MSVLSVPLRKSLEAAIKAARRAAEKGSRAALKALAVDQAEPHGGMSAEQRKLRNRLRAHGRQLGDERGARRATQSIDRLIAECAYEHWHRLLFARFLADNGLLIEPENNVSISLAECRELARERRVDPLLLATSFAERMLPQIFRTGDPVLDVQLPPETRQELERLVESLASDVFAADDSLGWTYQFWQADRKREVNDSGVKIGAKQLPAVTQLFTEDYMVLFLLHNTLGAWWAGKILARRADLAASAPDEATLRAACALPGIDWEFLRFNKGPLGTWQPAAGSMSHWPRAASEITVFDPSMGSGHFLVFALPILVALRVSEENLPAVAAVSAVLAENLFGLEVDPRCTQIAAFNLALAAWRKVGYRPLPRMNVACSGISPSVPVGEWIKLCGDDVQLRGGMERLYRLFEQASTLGSLIDPRSGNATLLAADYRRLEPLLTRAMAMEAADDETQELAVAAAGIARAGVLLAQEFVLVATNVPYLSRGRQDPVLAHHCETHFEEGKTDLATSFMERCRTLAGTRGTAALVTPQSWLTQDHYATFRKRVLRTNRFGLAGHLGPGAFSGISGEVVKPLLIVFDALKHDARHTLQAFDTTGSPTAADKAASLAKIDLKDLNQAKQLANPKQRIQLSGSFDDARLLKYADFYNGIQSGDSPRFIRRFWEIERLDQRWAAQQTTVDATTPYGGMSGAVLWENGEGRLERFVREKLASANTGAWLRGRQAWGRRGVLVSAMGKLHVSLYLGTLFDDNTVAIVPKRDRDLPAIWAACSDESYPVEVRKIDKKLNVRGPLVEVPFNLTLWSEATAKGVPSPTTNQPTQWLCAGSPKESEAPLQMAAARLLGYRWPRQTGSSFPDCPAIGRDGLEKFEDDDGIVCLPALKGEAPAAARLRDLLAAAFGKEWSAAKQAELLAQVGFAGSTLEGWLQDGFFEQHCELFHQRPFLWHVWDGIKKGGFSALVNYHKLVGPDGQGRRTLEALIYSYLGDWITQQRGAQKAGTEGADARVAAAEHLKGQLEKILDGEPPYDIFVRWKPLHEQAIGWEPDIDDGVRLNIRPFLAATLLKGGRTGAGVLRAKPKGIKWEKDRGTEPERSNEDYPWFWNWDGKTVDFEGGRKFDGCRWNELHYTKKTKNDARARSKPERTGKLA